MFPGGVFLTEGVYSNGLPHPSRRMRLRIATELGGVVVLTIAFLVFCELWMPNWLNTGTYVGLALVALGPILFKRHEIEEKIWGPPESPEFDRIRRCTLGMFALTVPPVVLFFIIGFAARHWLPWLQPWLFQGQPPCDMISVHFFITLFLRALGAAAADAVSILSARPPVRAAAVCSPDAPFSRCRDRLRFSASSRRRAHHRRHHHRRHFLELLVLPRPLRAAAGHLAHAAGHDVFLLGIGAGFCGVT